MQQLTSLDMVEEAFSHWRQTRRYRCEAIPLSLWEMVSKLCPEYKRSEICRRLRLSGQQFKQRVQHGTALAAHDFVVAKANQMITPLDVSKITLTLQGQQRSLSLTLPTSNIAQVLPHL